MKIRVLAYDPGLSLSGWSVLDSNSDSAKITVVKFGNITSTKDVSRVDMRSLVNIYGRRLLSLAHTRARVDEHIQEFQPHFIACEDVFYHPGRPNAFIALSQWVNTVEMWLYRMYGKKLYKVPTRLVKSVVTGSGAGGKRDVKTALLNHPNIIYKQPKQLDKFNEHVADSVGVGVTFIHNIMPSLDEESRTCHLSPISSTANSNGSSIAT